MAKQTDRSEIALGIVLVLALLFFVFACLMMQTDQINQEAERSRAHIAEMQAIQAEADRKHYFKN
jgi:hypothetical protein